MTRRTGVWLGAIAVSVAVAVALVASIRAFSGGSDAEASPVDTSPRESVQVVIAGTNDANEEGTEGGIRGEGTFRETGSIADRGRVTAYRGLSVLNEGVILLRFATKGNEGAITYLVRIDTTRRPVTSRWTIESATGTYKGLHGKGIESDNATFTVSTLRGKVWR